MRENRFKTGLLILVFFIKIGCFTFGGGWSILAQIEQEFVDKRQWITKSDLLDLTAVGRSLPGIMITNISLLFGYQMAGWFGGLCAVVGIATPAVVILSLVTLVYDAVKANPWVWAALRGIRCAVVPIIGSSALSLSKEALKTRLGKIVCAVAFVLLVFAGFSNIVMVLLGIGAALIWMEVKKHASV